MSSGIYLSSLKKGGRRMAGNIVYVAVGSKNPAKIKAAQLAFKKMWPNKEFKFEGVDVESGVSKQPMGTLESIKGAQNRAKRALIITGADYAVGMEGGLQMIANTYYDCTWIAIMNKNENVGMASTVHMQIPASFVKKIIEQGKELGDVIDEEFGRQNAKQAEGYFGLMTNNAFTRTSESMHAVIAALAVFNKPHLFGIQTSVSWCVLHNFEYKTEEKCAVCRTDSK